VKVKLTLGFVSDSGLTTRDDVDSLDSDAFCSRNSYTIHIDITGLVQQEFL